MQPWHGPCHACIRSPSRRTSTRACRYACSPAGRTWDCRPRWAPYIRRNRALRIWRRRMSPGCSRPCHAGGSTDGEQGHVGWSWHARTRQLSTCRCFPRVPRTAIGTRRASRRRGARCQRPRWQECCLVNGGWSGTRRAARADGLLSPGCDPSRCRVHHEAGSCSGSAAARTPPAWPAEPRPRECTHPWNPRSPPALDHRRDPGAHDGLATRRLSPRDDWRAWAVAEVAKERLAQSTSRP